jgi:hypothetical protein
LLRASPNQHRKNLTCRRMSLSRVSRGNVSDGAPRTFVRILYARLHKAGSGRGFLRWQTGRGSSEAVRWKNNQQHQARTVSAHRGKCAAMSAYRGEHGASSGPKISLSRSSCSVERTIWIADAHRDDGKRSDRSPCEQGVTYPLRTQRQICDRSNASPGGPRLRERGPCA